MHDDSIAIVKQKGTYCDAIGALLSDHACPIVAARQKCQFVKGKKWEKSARAGAVGNVFTITGNKLQYTEDGER